MHPAVIISNNVRRSNWTVGPWMGHKAGSASITRIRHGFIVMAENASWIVCLIILRSTDPSRQSDLSWNVELVWMNIHSRPTRCKLWTSDHRVFVWYSPEHSNEMLWDYGHKCKFKIHRGDWGTLGHGVHWNNPYLGGVPEQRIPRISISGRGVPLCHLTIKVNSQPISSPW